MAVQPSAEDVLLLKVRVFLAAKHNQPQVIQDCLASLHPDVVKDVLHRYSTYRSKPATPLIIASLKRHLKVVHLLVNKYNVDVNQKVFWNYSGYNALHCAAHYGYLDIVKVLVRKGSDISAVSRDNFKAVYAACHRNHLDVLKYLVENGAPIDYHGFDSVRTCLMIACRNGNQEMVEYLLSKGADPNKQDDEGGTALHEAADRGASDIIRLLLQHEARLSKDEDGYSPLMVAAMKPSGDSVQVLLESTDVSRLERIEGLELLGATLAGTNVNAAFMFMRQAMEERCKDSNAILLKPNSHLPTLGNVQESQTLEELQTRLSDQHLFRLECLAILSRILRPDNCIAAYSLIEYSDELQSLGSHDKAVAVLMHGLKTAIRSSTSLFMIKHEMQLMSVRFVQMLQNGIFAFFPDLEEVMELTLAEMEKSKVLLDYLTNSDNKIWLCYILLALKVAQGQEEGRRLQKLVERFSRLTLGSQVLFEAVCFHQYRPDCLRGVEDLPYDLLVTFLLHCGADVHRKDEKKNSALHIVASLSEVVPDSDLYIRMARTLLGAGALVGVQNNEGESPLAMAGPMLAAELRPLYPVSLQSLAAIAVVNYNIPYAATVPDHLAEFIEKH